MFKLLLRLLINMAALWVAFQFVPGIHVIQSTWPALVGMAFLFGLINALLRPLLTLLTCPLIILTLGLGTLLINTLLFWLAGLAGQYFGIGFTVEGFWPAFFGALVVTLVSTILTLFLHDELKGKRKRAK